MRKIIVTPGDIYGRLMLLCEAPPVLYVKSQQRKRAFLCKCGCGNFTVVLLGDLRSGRSTSCGCYRKEAATTHGSHNTKLYRVWDNAKARCSNPNHKRYHRYGGRGIAMHAPWKSDFAAFRDYVVALPSWAGEDSLGRTATASLSLDRIDNDAGYVPGNLRWATAKQQANNRSR